MKIWQAISLGTLFGVSVTLSLGAVGYSHVASGPYRQLSKRDIVNTSHIDHATFIGPLNDKLGYQIHIRYDSGSTEDIAIDDGPSANTAWDDLKSALNINE